MKMPLALLCGALLLAAGPPAVLAEGPASGLAVDPVDRPAELWWPTPDEYLYAVFGPCGVRRCCKTCVVGKACGNTCIRADYTCHVGCGCACDRPTYFIELDRARAEASALDLSLAFQRSKEACDEPP